MADRRRAVFLDRDGTLIEDIGYIADPELVRFLPGAVASLREMREAGFLLVLVSNQSGIGRGLITPAQADAVNRRCLEALTEEGIHLDAVRYCPHAPDVECACRKPAPGLLLDAAHELDIELSASFMVGNSAVDIAAGEAAGCATLAFGPGHADLGADFGAPEWGTASAIIRRSSTGA